MIFWRREILIYGGLLLTLALLMHPDLLSAPTDRLHMLVERGNFFHLMIYPFILYLILGVGRFIFFFLKKLLTKSS